jgi:hypothetical protein
MGDTIYPCSAVGKTDIEVHIESVALIFMPVVMTVHPVYFT